MKVQTIETEIFAISEARAGGSLTWMQRYMLRRFHPQAIFLDSAAAIWAIYFFLRHEWVAALAVVVVSRVLGTFLAWKMDYEAFGGTVWGRLAFLHLHPVNSLIQVVAAVTLFYGIWMHSTVTILLGLSALLLGHLFGWSKVMRGI